jgi:imidazolonepropionase-like amidohydrolase
MQSKGTLARVGVLAGLLGSGLVVPAQVSGQYQTVPSPPAYALEGVTVVQADGRRTDGVTIVVRGDLIEAMGQGVAIPADAEVLEGDSLIVYPGIVDGSGTADHEFPQPDIDRSEVEIWNAPRSLQGFMPARRVVAVLTADGEEVAAERKQGIVAAAVHPEGGMMPGRGALVMYRADASVPAELVVQPTLGPTFAFRGGQGVYPGTLFGVTAFMRQAFEDARYRAQFSTAHQRDPSRLTTPAYDPDYEVLQEVLDGDVPVYFRADGATDILRVVGLAEEYGFRPVIVGGGEAWKVADELRRREIPVLVSVDFREPRRWDPDEEAEEPLDAAAEREKGEIEDLYANAGRLAEAGVTFALTSGGSGEILEGARTAVEHGLPEAAALAAVTTTPAALYGIPHVTRIEAGLPATFIVTDGPLFAEETRILHTFVEGHREAGAEPGAAAGSAEDAVAFAGEWEMQIDAQGQRMQATLEIEQDGATFTGSMTMEGQRLELRDGVINGNEISVTALMDQGGQTLEVKITGTVEEDEASGEADAGPLGTATWTATRRGPGGAR